MVKIEPGSVQERQLAKRCHLASRILCDYVFVRTKTYDILNNIVGDDAVVEMTGKDVGGLEMQDVTKYMIGFGDRIWAKRPEMVLSSLRDRIALELVQLEGYDTVEASRRAVELTDADIAAIHDDGTFAEAVLECKFRTEITEREFEDLYSRFNTEDSFIKNNFGKVERIDNRTYIFGGSNEWVDAIEMWQSAIEMQEEMKVHDVIISCRPM